MGALEAIIYTAGPPARLQILDQRLLPLRTEYIDVSGPDAAWHAIKNRCLHLIGFFTPAALALPQDMQVRGAPAIAITAALSLAVELTNSQATSQLQHAQQALQAILGHLDHLITRHEGLPTQLIRPTAVNLGEATRKLGAIARAEERAHDATAQRVVSAVKQAAEAMLGADLEANKAGAGVVTQRVELPLHLVSPQATSLLTACGVLQAMAQHGASSIKSAAQGSASRQDTLRILTHCNTGSLATAGYGTALGIVRALHEQGGLDHVYCTESRPFNQGAATGYALSLSDKSSPRVSAPQTANCNAHEITACKSACRNDSAESPHAGHVHAIKAPFCRMACWQLDQSVLHAGSRLTAYELVHDGIPATLVIDSAASALMAAGRVDAIVVGADRVAANGDTANKIGTLSLAVNAARYGELSVIASSRSKARCCCLSCIVCLLWHVTGGMSPFSVHEDTEIRAPDKLCTCSIPFFVAAPTTTLDPELDSGSAIEIEERAPEEITHLQGVQLAAPGIQVCTQLSGTGTAARSSARSSVNLWQHTWRHHTRPHTCSITKSVLCLDRLQVWNPAFDVTPADLITGIITERGPIHKTSSATFDVAAILTSEEQASAPESLPQNGHAKGPATKLDGHAHPDQQGSFHALNVDTVKSYLAGIPHLAARLGPADGHPDWQPAQPSLLLGHVKRMDVWRLALCNWHETQHPCLLLHALYLATYTGMGSASLGKVQAKIIAVGVRTYATPASDAVTRCWSGPAVLVQEVGDGNINFVYIVEGPEGALVLKQGLPYIRIAPDWPLTQPRMQYLLHAHKTSSASLAAGLSIAALLLSSAALPPVHVQHAEHAGPLAVSIRPSTQHLAIPDRVRMEAQAMQAENEHCPEHVPSLHHYDAAMALLVMDYIPPPHDILRRALVAGACQTACKRLRMFSAHMQHSVCCRKNNAAGWMLTACAVAHSAWLDESAGFADAVHGVYANCGISCIAALVPCNGIRW
ncbi:Isopentenyl-diphosphate delta-isomerase 2 [Pseudocyphellaria aurata]|nr:Isopentenyl-diphosphate delta-isomerase 2 [Pseudocyphellaria aurata]